MIGSYEETQILSVVDSRTWQHSWHLPRNEHGIDWSNPEALQRCLGIVKEYETHARNLLARCVDAREILERELKDKETSGNE